MLNFSLWPLSHTLNSSNILQYISQMSCLNGWNWAFKLSTTQSSVQMTKWPFCWTLYSNPFGKYSYHIKHSKWTLSFIRFISWSQIVGKLTQKCRMIIIYDNSLLIGNCQYYSISYDTRSSVILYHCKT